MLTAALLCLVVGITDGDTLKARCESPKGYQEMRVRIHAIDAPESSQAFGQASRKSLSKLCFKKQAQIVPQGNMSYNRVVAAVKCAGTDVAHHQVANGMAWVATKYAANRPDLPRLQTKAKQNKIGMWVDPNIVEPWKYRHGK